MTPLRLAPMRISASGMPWASVTRWSFEPGRARSVRWGPVFDPIPLHDHDSSSNIGVAMASSSAKPRRAPEGPRQVNTPLILLELLRSERQPTTAVDVARRENDRSRSPRSRSSARSTCRRSRSAVPATRSVRAGRCEQRPAPARRDPCGAPARAQGAARNSQTTQTRPTVHTSERSVAQFSR